jgi:tripartite-type tricarboxylate transporter receptor subunit TctC
LPPIATGKVRALAVTAPSAPRNCRNANCSEAALPGYDITTWFGLLAPAGTPRDVVNKLNSTIVAIVNDPEMASYLVGRVSIRSQTHRSIRSVYPK